MKSAVLLATLTEQTQSLILEVKKLRQLDIQRLNWRQDAGSWSILECLAHLNLYGDDYLPRIEASMAQSSTHPETEFKSGLIGNYFAESMLPKQKPNEMKTFKVKDPIHSKLDHATIDRFLMQQERMLGLLQRAKSLNIGRIRVNTSISVFVRLKLGDMFRFMVNHALRHLNQINRIQSRMPSSIAQGSR